MNITLNGTKITQDTRNLAFEKNSGVDEIVITVDTDESWSYKLDVKYPDKYNIGNDTLYNIIDLDRNGNTCSVTLNSEMLPFNGKYTMQLRGVNGDKVYHSDTFEAWVKYSIEPGSTYNPVPSEFYQVEARLDDKVDEAKKYAENAETASTRMPKISSDNTWLIWDTEIGDYVDTSVKASGDSVTVDVELSDTSKNPVQNRVVKSALDSLSEKNVRSAALDEDNMVSFKNADGVVLFTLDLSELGTPASYGNLVLSAESLTIEEGGTGDFTVALDSAPSANQIVYLAVSDNTRLSVSPSSLTFTPENYSTPQTVTVTSAQDDDKNDDTITVTLTSKKVDGKQLVVTVSDIDKVPQLVTDGLILYVDYTSWDGESTSIQDSVSGVTINLASGGFAKETNGIRGNGVAYRYAEIKAFDAAYAAFIEGYNKNQAVSFEWFGNFMLNSWFARIGGNNYTPIGPGHNYANGSSVSNRSGNITVSYKFIDANGKTQSIGTSSRFTDESISYANDFVHVVSTLSSDGVVTLYFNGVETATVTAENFASWPVLNPTTDDTSAIIRFFNALFSTGGTSSVAQAEGNWVSSQRIYNRVLTQEEIISNMKAEASRLGLSTFQ